MTLDWYCILFLLSLYFPVVLHLCSYYFNLSWCNGIQKDLIKRLHSLLTIKESAANVPKNLEACRRLEFFTNSLSMRMPVARPVSEMLSFRWGFLSSFLLDPLTVELLILSHNQLHLIPLGACSNHSNSCNFLFRLLNLSFPITWQEPTDYL